MDEQASTMTKAALLVVGAAVVLTVPAQRLFGDTGVQVVLVLVLVTVVVLGWSQVTGRPLPRLKDLGRRRAAPAPVVEDAWRSERWIREAVERGLRALEEWRLEQHEA